MNLSCCQFGASREKPESESGVNEYLYALLIEAKAIFLADRLQLAHSFPGESISQSLTSALCGNRLISVSESTDPLLNTARREVMNPPVSAALGTEAGNLNMRQRHGRDARPRATKVRPANVAPHPIDLSTSTGAI